MKFSFLFLLLFVVLAGCEHYEGPTSVSGQVVDRFTGQPVPRATVQVGGIASGLGAGGTSQGNTYPTDAQGHFAFSFEASAQQNYTLFASTPSGYTSDYGDCPLLKAGHTNDGLLVKTAAPAWVKINCIDDLPLNKIGLYTDGYRTGAGENQNIGPGNFSFIRPMLSNTTGSIYWEILDAQAQVTKSRQPLTVANFDTAIVTIHF
ncbi:MAG: hypothetical protein EOO55_01090 [Hymenobacter sp.]|nr:MAG: hypothetical protein EOO55_01090 [Hymenobacter sp.]